MGQRQANLRRLIFKPILVNDYKPWHEEETKPVFEFILGHLLLSLGIKTEGNTNEEFESLADSILK